MSPVRRRGAARHDGFSVLDVGLKALEPVGAGPFQALEVQDSLAGEEAGLDLLGFEWSVEHPAVVCGIEIVRRDEDLEPMRLRGLEDTLHVLDGVVLGEAFFEQRPRSAFFAQDFVLRIGEYDCRIGLVNFHRFSI